MNSDDDCPIVEDLFVGYDKAFNLIIMVAHTDYCEPQYNCTTCAIINKDEAAKLAKRLQISMKQLPGFIRDSMDEYRDIVNATFSQVRDCFKEIIECLIDEKCRFRIERHTGRHGFCSC